MSPTMSNTQSGPFVVNCGESLEGKEGFLVELSSVSGVPQATLPNANTDYALFVVEDGNISGRDATIRPLDPSQLIRVKAKGTGAAGVALVLADVATAADKGKLRAIPSASGTYRVHGLALEDFVDGQLVKVSPHHLGNVVVA